MDEIRRGSSSYSSKFVVSAGPLHLGMNEASTCKTDNGILNALFDVRLANSSVKPIVPLKTSKINNQTSTLTSVPSAPISWLKAIRGACKTSKPKKKLGELKTNTKDKFSFGVRI